MIINSFGNQLCEFCLSRDKHVSKYRIHKIDHTIKHNIFWIFEIINSEQNFIYDPNSIFLFRKLLSKRFLPE